MGLAQLNYQNSNPRSNKNLEYSYVQILAIVSTHTFQHQVKCPKTRMKTPSSISLDTLGGCERNPLILA